MASLLLRSLLTCRVNYATSAKKQYTELTEQTLMAVSTSSRETCLQYQPKERAEFPSSVLAGPTGEN